MAIRIRRRERINASPPEGLRQEWTEYQVVDGRKILARLGTEAEAMKWLAQHGYEVR